MYIAGSRMCCFPCNKMCPATFIESNVKKGIHQYRQGVHPLGRSHGDTGARAEVVDLVGARFWEERRVGVVMEFLKRSFFTNNPVHQAAPLRGRGD